MRPPLTIVIPALNEAHGIKAALQALELLRSRGVEIVLVDGGSLDDTIEQACSWADTIVSVAQGRAKQMNAGAASSYGDTLLFLHADTQLPPDADQLILASIEEGFLWGRFDVRITGAAWMLRVVAVMMNWRSRFTGIATGDQAMFVRRDVFEHIGGFPDQALMEDIELSKRLCKLSRPACLRMKVTTSGRRWESRGVWRTIFLMWCLRWRYWRGESPEQLAQAYR